MPSGGEVSWVHVLGVLIPVVTGLIVLIGGLYYLGARRELGSLKENFGEDLKEVKTSLERNLDGMRDAYRDCRARRIEEISALESQTHKVELEVRGLTNEDHRREQKYLVDALTKLISLLEKKEEK